MDRFFDEQRDLKSKQLFASTDYNSHLTLSCKIQIWKTRQMINARGAGGVTLPLNGVIINSTLKPQRIMQAALLLKNSDQSNFY